MSHDEPDREPARPGDGLICAAQAVGAQALAGAAAPAVASQFTQTVFNDRRLSDGLRSLVSENARMLPPNWIGLQYSGVDRLKAMLLEEGLALAWVSLGEVLRRVLDAPDYMTR